MAAVISCIICMENYKRGDEIYSTSCGHLYHVNCIENWSTRSPECPQCRAVSSINYKIYPSFEEPSVEAEKLANLKQMFEQSIKNASELQQQLEGSQSSLLNLREEYNIKEKQLRDEMQEELQCVMTETAKAKLELEESVLSLSTVQQQLDESETNFICLQEQFERNENHLKEYEAKIRRLSADNLGNGPNSEETDKNQEYISKLVAENRILKTLSEKRGKELTAKMVENKKLQAEMENMKSSGLIGDVTNFPEQLKIQEIKIKQLSDELQRQIQTNTDLIVDKMKLQSLKDYGLLSAPSTSTKNKQKFVSHDMSDKSENNSIHVEHMPQNGESVVIRGLQDPELISSPQSFVLKLAAKLEINCTESDIVEAKVLPRLFNIRNNIQSGNFTMLVKFKSLNLKIEFLANKDKLKQDPNTKHLVIYEYQDDQTHALYHHAKCLKKFGYHWVYCKNNVCFVRKNERSPQIRINNKEQVDDLLTEAIKGSSWKSDLKFPEDYPF